MNNKRIVNTLNKEDANKRNEVIYVLYRSLAKKRNESGVIKEKKRKQCIACLKINIKNNYVHVVIESIFLQSIKADKVILCLDEDECTCENLPHVNVRTICFRNSFL